jgi:hypothetical protein
MPLCKFLAAQASPADASGRELRHARPEFITGAAPHDEAHFQSFRRIRRRQHAGARHDNALAALQGNAGHDDLLLDLIADLTAGFNRKDSGE